MRGVSTIVIAVCAALLSGCATPTPEAIAANDPLEAENRVVYRFDQSFDKNVVLPAAWFYFFYLPPPLRRGLHNATINLDLPVTFANDVLQGEVSRAGTALGRFAMNSTFGLAGLLDIAKQAGLVYRPADFGQTLGRYGVPEGPFLVLPIIGPDPPRDLLGDAADIALDPFVGRLSLAATLPLVSPFEQHTRDIILRQELERGSVDPYVTMRDVYRQLRADEIGAALPDPGEAQGK